jgi:hypothetical protein
MAAGDPGALKRNFSATAIQTSLVNSISSAATNDTTTSVAVVSVSGFPAVPFTLILDPDGSKEEVVTCVSLVGTTLQIVRGQDSTAAVAHSAGTSVRHGVSGRDFKEEQTHIAARGYDADSGILSNAGQTHVHGLQTGDGSIVGADQVATLTRKTLTTPVINGATLTGTVSSTASIVVSGAGTITGLSSAGMSASSAAPKSYVDAILVLQLASAASSATSASMAATSATSAATSASSALTSQTAAATSATSAAASASASASSAAAAATSATSAATSATSASTSATSAAASASASASSASAAATSASSALTSQTAAATSATSAAASATAAATSATSAAASATTASNSAATATTQAGNAATSASSAATSATAAATSAASAATSATASATSAGASATSATAAATSATSAAASATAAATSATSAAASATTASNSAATATTQATNAATSAASAATSATAAATSATSAAASATSAAASYDSFDDRYLGAKAVAPTVDNDGNALLTGALYWNTAVNKMYVWSGSAWGEISSSADIIAYKYTASSGATSVSGADDNGLTLTYTVGKEQVYINGVLQVRGSDYTASTGSSITGMAALTVNDIVTVLAFTAFSVSNTYTQAEADAKFVQQTNNYFAGKNFIINGNMNVSQRGTSLAGVASGASYLVDRFESRNNSLGTFTISQDTDAPAGFKTCSKLLVTTADASPAASDFFFYRTKLEGQALQSLKYGSASALTTTLSFWVKSNLIGTYIVFIDNPNSSGGAKAISKSYTINSADTWEKKSFTIPGDTASAFENNNALGLGINFVVGAGSDRTSGTLQTNWSSITNANTCVGQVNLAGTLNNYWQMTGVQLEIGSIPTEFQTATGTIQGELAACQRYYWRTTANATYTFAQLNGGIGVGNNANQANIALVHPVTMRSSTSTTIDYGGTIAMFNGGSAVTGMTLAMDSSSTQATRLAVTKTGSFAANIPYTFTAWGDAAAYIGLSAEL